MKKIASAVSAILLVGSVFSSSSSAEVSFKMESYSVFASPVITVSLPRSMSFVFNPYGLNINEKGIVDKSACNFKVIPNYVQSNENGWTVKNTSEIPIRMGVYAQADGGAIDDFSVRDANINTVDTSDEERKYLLLDIKASGGSSGTKNVTLLDMKLSTDEGDNSKTIDWKAGWWSDANEGTITVINDIPKNGIASVTMSGTTQNVGDIPWTYRDKATIYFVFSFDAEPPTGN